MRIVAGRYGGRKLSVPKNNDIRPTSDKIRGAIFNMLASRGAIIGANVLDGFCGTGALGLEALSRGAAHCTFSDKSRESLDLARLNAENFDAMDSSLFSLRDAQKIIQRRDNEDAYGLIFLDPPYDKGFIQPCLQALQAGDWFSNDCWIVCETERKAEFVLSSEFNIDLEKIYGATKVSLIRYSMA